LIRATTDDTAALRLVPLGGLGEFGLNALVLEWEDHLLLLDAGVLFPPAEMPGVDSIVPDFEYLAERAGRLRGILLTHGHEDHIGALSYALQAAPAPVYGSRLTLGFARKRLQERGVHAELRTLVPGQPVEIGPFRVHPIRVAHSVLDSLALAIETPAGVVLASGDFKIDATAPPDERTDVDSLSQWGDRGVLALLSDSTNVEQPGLTGGEEAVLPAFEQVLERTRGRVLVSCFATSIPRIQRVADLAVWRTGELPATGIPPLPPFLAIEILSPSNRPGEIHAKVADYLASGSKLVWVVDPACRVVSVYRSLLAPRRVETGELLQGEDVLPGLSICVAALLER